MGSVNRFRLAGIKYDSAKLCYDDKLFQPKDFNLYIDLKNGIGKTFLAQMFLQTILPNSKFEEKKPISILFNNKNKNKYIHSVVEFKLDEGSPFKYALVGFCGYSKDAASFEESDTYDQGFGTLKYICLYNNYNENDIANIPYTSVDKNGNRSVISNKKLESILKNLQNAHRADYAVLINKTIKSHHNELAKLGINPVEYQEMIELNKFEGNAANYLKPYRKGKDFIFKKLIPIVEESYALRNSTDYESAENRAETLLTLRETLNKLQLKQSLKDDYLYVETELANLSNKLEELSSMYTRKENFLNKLNNYKYLIHTTKVNTENQIEDIFKTLSMIKESKNEIESELHYISMVRKAIEINSKDIEIQKQTDIYESLKKSLNEKDNEIRDKKDTLFRAECEKIYVDYKAFKGKADKAELELESLKKDYQEILTDYNYWGSHYEALLEKAYNETKVKCDEAKEELNSLASESAELSEEIGGINSTIKSLTKSKDELNEQLDVISKELNRVRQEIFHLDIDEINNEISNVSYKLDNLIKDKEDGELKVRNIEHDILKINSDISLAVERFENTNNRYEELNIFLNKYHEDLEVKNKIVERYPLCNNLIEYLENSIDKISSELGDKTNQYDKIDNKIALLKKDKDVSFSDEALEQFDIISNNYKSALLGTSYLESKTSDEKNELIKRFELLPYSILLNRADFNKFKIDAVIRKKFNDQIVPVICSDSLKDNNLIKLVDLSFTNKDASYFTDIENRKKEILNLEKELFNLTSQIENLEYSKRSLRVDANKIKIFDDKYNEEDILAEKKEFSDLSNKIKELPKEIDTLKDFKTNLEYELDNLNDKIINYKKSIKESENLLSQLNKELTSFNKLLSLGEKHRVIEEKKNKVIKEIADEDEHLNATIKSININKDKTDRYNLIYQKLFIEITSLNHERQNLSFHQKENIKIDPTVILEEAKSNFLAYKSNIEGQIANLKQLEETYKSFNDIANDRIKDLNNKNNLHFGEKYTLEKLSCIELLTSDYSIYIADLNKQIEAKMNSRNKLTINNVNARIERIIGNKESLVDNYNKNFDRSYNDVLLDIKEKDFIIEEFLTREATLYRKAAELERKESENYSNKESLKNFLYDLDNYNHKLETIAIKNNYTLKATPPKEINLKLEDILQCENDSTNINKSLERSKNTYLNLFDIILGKLDNSNLINFKIDLEYLRNKELLNSTDCMTNIEQLIGNNGYIESIKFEMEQINKEIEGLKKDEETFINQCLQRCEQVYKELLSLTHLSKIVINDKKIPLIEIVIKAEEEDIRRAKMKTYINTLVTNLAEVEDNKKHEYLAGKLKLSEMFAQYVLNANKCDIKVYKAASIAENAEYYYWDELIGSTGQTNGMAYNIFISLLSFIRKLYNPHISDTSRKTILLDAPFSGMVASYIWEPIIKLLDENNFQIICLGYQLPNNLSPLFQVKVHLEDQMTSSGLSIITDTVKSEVELDNDNYVRFIGNQIDLFEE